ncbi:unnamed protein product [Cylindrotheca closterium]|uniref:Transmembrane protein n=1 Tax=Cylindrotheca closterium TaxID=2856 RepID=A0AAD2FSJ4_9STRA|nr:unnamed protein product [Cylindrotheca closterium]
MRGFTSICILFFFLTTSVNGFTTKKREQGGHKFQPVNVGKDDKGQQESVPATSPAAPLFAFPPSSAVSAIPVIYEDELDEDINISYGVALVSCALSLALGFGFGYGV